MTTDRWEPFTDREAHLIHHALRVLLKHPIQLPDEDAESANRIADEIWNRHCKKVGAV